MISPPTSGAEVTFLDGTTTMIIGEIDLVVSHQSVDIIVRCVVVRTVVESLGADILLGIDYMMRRGPKMVVSFPSDMPITTQFLSAAAVQPPALAQEINGGDFTLRRMPSGSWSLSWQWAKKVEGLLSSGVDVYHSKLKTEKAKVDFREEVSKWVTSGYLIPYRKDKHGEVKCRLTWNPVIQAHKSTKVRPTLDYSILNPYIRSQDYVAQSEVCHDALRKWRRYEVAWLVDIHKAYMNVHVAADLLPYQVVRHEGQLMAMSRMGFGLNVAPRVLKVLLQYIFSAASLTDCTVVYRDDILVGCDTQAPNSLETLAKTVDDVRRVLLEHGLPTKEPVNLFDFSRGNTRALGLELYRDGPDIRWKRRSDAEYVLTSTTMTNREVASFIGKIAPAHYPCLGSIRPAALRILSMNGRRVHETSWNAPSTPLIIRCCQELSDATQTKDEATGKWRIPDSSDGWVLATDASSSALGCCVIAMREWLATRDASTSVVEDHCWLVKDPSRHINVLELEAVIKSLNLLDGYAKKTDSVLILNDSRVVVGWLNRLMEDRRVNHGGIHDVLVGRRLLILKELMQHYASVRVEWIPTDANPADRLTRYPSHWKDPVTVPLTICCAIAPTLRERIRDQQSRDPGCLSIVARLDESGQLRIENGFAYFLQADPGTSDLRLIIPESLVRDAIRDIHLSLGHAGWKSTWTTFKRTYYPKIENLARKTQILISECEICNVKNATAVATAGVHRSERVAPWSEVFIDTLQMGPATLAGPHLVVAVIDNYSKFAEAFPLSSRTAEDICDCVENVISRYGAIGTIRCDNGREFDNESFRHLASANNITLRFGSARHPGAQGTVERFHSSLLSIIRSLMFGEVGTNAHWSRFLQPALAAYRNRPHTSLAGRSPAEVLLGTPPTEVTSEFDYDVRRATIYDEIDTAEPDVDQPGPQPIQFSPNEPCLVRRDPRRRAKLDYPWVHGTIVQYLGRGAYLVSDQESRLQRFNEKSLAKLPADAVTLEPRPDAPAPVPTEDLIDPAEAETAVVPTGAVNEVHAPVMHEHAQVLPGVPPTRSSQRTHRPVRRYIEEVE